MPSAKTLTKFWMRLFSIFVANFGWSKISSLQAFPLKFRITQWAAREVNFS
jgi:hypothetical protein